MPVDDGALLHGAAARQQRERAVRVAQVLGDLPRGVGLSCARARSLSSVAAAAGERERCSGDLRRILQSTEL